MKRRYMFFRSSEKLNTSWQWAALVAYIGMMILNWLAGTTAVLGGVNTAEVSNANPTLFTPAGVTFSIWGAIYLLLGIFFFRMFEVWKPKKSAISNKTLNDVIRLFTISSVLNGAWLLAWQYKVLWFSVILMVALLITLAYIAILLRDKQFEQREEALVRLPFSVYFGWITVATVANISVWLVSMQWNGFGIRPGVWTVGVLLVAAVIAVVTTLRHKDWAYLAVFVWAYAGILLNHLSPNGYDGQYPSVIITLTILLAVFISLFLRVMPWLRENR